MTITRKAICSQLFLTTVAPLLSPTSCLASKVSLSSAGCDREDEDACTASVDLLQRVAELTAYQEKDAPVKFDIAQSFDSSSNLGEKDLPHLMRQVVYEPGVGVHLVQVPLPGRTQNRTEDLPALTPNPAALVAVCASSINPSDHLAMIFDYEAKYGDAYKRRRNMGMGQDVAGVIIALDQASECEQWHVGQHIWGMMEPYPGSFAEYALMDCGRIGPRPHTISNVEAALLPQVALTSLQAFHWSGAPWAHRPVVLILGGSSGTGHTGIQIAKALGAGRIVTTCSPHNFGFVKEMGADLAIDYHGENWWSELPPYSVDIIYNAAMKSEMTAGLAVSSRVIKPNGIYVTLTSNGLADNVTAIKQHYFLLDQQSTQHLEILRGMVEAGQLRATMMQGFALDRVLEALKISYVGHVAGKLSISPINVQGVCSNEGGNAA